ncbi:transcriptional regulator, TetR family [mine drainage metagenome]|uniref:Transcriptional regulator, TetR family n=1 Tax=mine drainage metagenome TaxID=410659 RepID=T0ZMT1_9ZZZZ
MRGSPWRASRERVRDRQVKREAVIRAAAHAFNRKGYHNTSLDDIAAALRVSKPTVYYYVSNKEQLLFECFVAGIEPIRTAFRNARSQKAPARERLRTVLGHYGQAVASEFGWCMVRAEDQDLSPAMSAHIKSLKSEIDQGIRRLLREGRSRRIDPPVRSEDDCFRARRLAQLDRALVSRESIHDRRRDRRRLHHRF